jgi:hypothetical protein
MNGLDSVGDVKDLKPGRNRRVGAHSRQATEV